LDNTTRAKRKQAVDGGISGLRQFARALLRETSGDRGRFSQQTQRLLFDMGTLALATGFELKTLLTHTERRKAPTNG
jgi:hypothetical protein